MLKFKNLLKYFSPFEWGLWTFSLILIVLSFVIFDGENYLTMLASLVGATSLIFNAKGNPFGQVLMIAFSVIYAIISYSFAYYGEMITYVGMSAPMAVFSLISWLKNPHQKGKAEVEVNVISKKEMIFMGGLAIIITTAFYFILKALGTSNLLVSTFSVTTSFCAVYLTFRRSAYFALWYAFNDIVLIVLWILASISNISYLSVVICFFAFLINDFYTFISWNKMRVRQSIDNNDVLQ